MTDGNRYGWIPNNPDDRDFEFNVKKLYGTVELSRTVDLSVALPVRPLLQGPVPSCVAHAIANQMYVVERTNPIRDSVPSRAFIYYAARRQHQDTLALTGTFPRLAYRAIQKLGCPPEDAWPYEIDRLNTAPTSAALRFAQSRYGLKYYSIVGDRCQQIRQALAVGRPVCFGTQVTAALEHYHVNDVIKAPDPEEPLLGGHYMCIIGYFSDMFIVANSWRGRERVLVDESLINWMWSGDFMVAEGWGDQG